MCNIDLQTMESNNDITNHLPADAVDIMNMLFERGNVVKDFKLVGNHRGYSMTLHITHPVTTHTQGSPTSTDTSFTTPSSNRKSPSASQRDYDRRQAWMTTKNYETICTPIATQTEEQHVLDDIDMNLVEHFDAHIVTHTTDTIRRASSYTCLVANCDESEFNDSEMTEDRPKVTSKSVHIKPIYNEHNAAKQKKVFGTVESAHSILHDKTYAKRVFKDAISNPCRNAMYCKLVNDDHTGQNCIVGLADDLLIRYDTDHKLFTHWIVTHLNDSDIQYQKCMDIVKCTDSIANGTHTESVNVLVLLLDKLVDQHQDYASRY